MKEQEKQGEGFQHGELYLERVEAAAMGTLTKALNDGDITKAWDVARLLRFLSMV